MRLTGSMLTTPHHTHTTSHGTAPGRGMHCTTVQGPLKEVADLMRPSGSVDCMIANAHSQGAKTKHGCLQLDYTKAQPAAAAAEYGGRLASCPAFGCDGRHATMIDSAGRVDYTICASHVQCKLSCCLHNWLEQQQHWLARNSNQHQPCSRAPQYSVLRHCPVHLGVRCNAAADILHSLEAL